MRRVRVACPAKLNLFLEILGPRPDGYHELSTVMVPVDLCDTLEVREAKRFSLDVEGARLDGVNTVEKAFRAVARRRRIPGARVRLVKRIPSGSGRGGGSSDAAAMVGALNDLYGLGLDRGEVCAGIGSDVNFFLEGRPALCTGRGEEVAPLAAWPAVHAVIAWPGFPLLTADVYRRASALPRTPRRDVFDFLKAFTQGRLARALFNRLEAAAFDLRPELKLLRRDLRKLPFSAVRMTGSGSALYGLCASRAGAERLARRVRRERGLFAAAVSLPATPSGILRP